MTVAVELATRLRAYLQIVHVIGLADYSIDPDSGDWEAAERTAPQAGFEQARSDLAGWPGEWNYHLERGDPVRALLSAAEAHNALMIIVGSRGGGLGTMLQRLLVGAPSVSHGLLRDHVPVLLVPMP